MGTSSSTASCASPAIPLFNNGFVGKLLIKGIEKLGPSAGAWLSGPVAGVLVQRVGIVGGLVGGGIGTYRLIQEGNPIDAYEKQGRRVRG